MNVRLKLQHQVFQILLRRAFFRWENALIFGVALFLSIAVPRPVPRWPFWGWLFLALLGVATVAYRTLTDRDAQAEALNALLHEEFDPSSLRDPALRSDVERALAYQQRVEELIQRHRAGPLRDRLEQTAARLTQWVGGIFSLAQMLDAHRSDPLIARDRASLPTELAELGRRRETNTETQQWVDQTAAGKRRHLASLDALDQRMQHATLALERSLAALGTVHNQVRLIDSQDLASGKSERLLDEIQEQVQQLDELTASLAHVHQQPEALTPVSGKADAAVQIPPSATERAATPKG